MSVRLESTHPDDRRRIAGPRPDGVTGGSVPLDADLFSVTIEYASAARRVIRLAGEVDMLTAPDLRACIVDELAARPQEMVLDFSAVTFFGCSGLAVLVEARQYAEDQGAVLHLAGTEPTVARLLYVTRLAALFGDSPLPPDRAAA